MLMLRVVRFSKRAPRCASRLCSVLDTLAAGRRRASAAFEKLPLSTTRTKTFIARNRSMLGVPFCAGAFVRDDTTGWGFVPRVGRWRLGGRGFCFCLSEFDVGLSCLA